MIKKLETLERRGVKKKSHNSYLTVLQNFFLITDLTENPTKDIDTLPRTMSSHRSMQNFTCLKLTGF